MPEPEMPRFGPHLVDFLQSGCSLIVGTVSAEGDPHAGRAWGLTVVADGPPTVRMVLDADDAITLEHLADRGAVAITGADVPTLRSVQLKGRALAVEPATEVDRARARRFCDDFFTDIVETDGTERALLERLVPVDYVVCLVEIDELFDQTPGPGAGAALSSETP